jgi:hypothetical protein
MSRWPVTPTTRERETVHLYLRHDRFRASVARTAGAYLLSNNTTYGVGSDSGARRRNPRIQHGHDRQYCGQRRAAGVAARAARDCRPHAMGCRRLPSVSGGTHPYRRRVRRSLRASLDVRAWDMDIRAVLYWVRYCRRKRDACRDAMHSGGRRRAHDSGVARADHHRVRRAGAWPSHRHLGRGLCSNNGSRAGSRRLADRIRDVARRCSS